MNCTAEEKIKQAALQVFVKKGFANCSSRFATKVAGILGEKNLTWIDNLEDERIKLHAERARNALQSSMEMVA